MIGFVVYTGNRTKNHLYFEFCQHNTLLSDGVMAPEAVLPAVN